MQQEVVPAQPELNPIEQVENFLIKWKGVNNLPYGTTRVLFGNQLDMLPREAFMYAATEIYTTHTKSINYQPDSGQTVQLNAEVSKLMIDHPGPVRKALEAWVRAQKINTT